MRVGAGTEVPTGSGEKAVLQAGQRVRVRQSSTPGHVRTPWYVQGKSGLIVRELGRWLNPEILAVGREDPYGVYLYAVEFEQHRLWCDYQGCSRDRLVLDLYAHWLEPLVEGEDVKLESDG